MVCPNIAMKPVKAILGGAGKAGLPFYAEPISSEVKHERRARLALERGWTSRAPRCTSSETLATAGGVGGLAK